MVDLAKKSTKSIFALSEKMRNSPRYNTGKTGIKLKASG